MKIFFDHIYGNTTTFDLIYSLALAEVSIGEEESALDKGWTPIDSYFYPLKNLIWINSRTTRINIENFKWRKKYRRLKKNDVTFKFFLKGEPMPYDQECERVYEHYCKLKKYNDHSDQLYDHDFKDNDYVVYFYKNKIIAYSSFKRFENSVVAGEFAWDYEMPELNMGYFCVNVECEYYSRMGLKYYYNPFAYQLVCDYKSHFDKFEWWTGREWNTDKKIFRTLLKNDSATNTLEDLDKNTQKFYILKEQK